MSHRPHSGLKPQEAALLAGEVTKPIWQSKNEGIHERISFEDSIWGFDLAGGSFYKTPLRVTSVKPGSRADKAGIRPGDRLKRINDIDTSLLTIQEAHEIIIESGIHLRIAVTAPEDLEDSYHCWQDGIEDGYDSEAERRLEEEKARRRIIHCRTNANWSLQWPWVSKRRVIYKESNCYLVPSKYENKHREQFTPQPSGPKTPDDIVLFSKSCEKKQNQQSSMINNEELRTETEAEELVLKNHNGIEKTKDVVKNGVKDAHVNEKKALINDVPLEKLNGIKEEAEEDTTVTDNGVVEEALQNGKVIDVPVGKLNGIEEESEEDTTTTDNGILEEVLQNGEVIDVSVGKLSGIEEKSEDDTTITDNSGLEDVLQNGEVVDVPVEKLNGIEEESEAHTTITDNSILEEVLQSEEVIDMEGEDRIIENLLENNDTPNNSLSESSGEDR